MTRQELIDALTRTYDEQGYEGLGPILQDMLDHGQIHDPEWRTCRICRREYERPTYALPEASTCMRCRESIGREPRKPVGQRPSRTSGRH